MILSDMNLDKRHIILYALLVLVTLGVLFLILIDMLPEAAVIFPFGIGMSIVLLMRPDVVIWSILFLQIVAFAALDKWAILSFGEADLFLIDVLVVGILLCILLRLMMGDTAVVGKVGIVELFYWGFICCSLIAAITGALSNGFVASMRESRIFVYSFLYVGIVLTVKRARQVRWAIITLLVATALGNVYAFYISVLGGTNFLNWDVRGVTTGGWRWVGWYFGVFLSSASLISLCWFVFAKRPLPKIILGASFFSNLFFLLTSLTRSAWLGFGAGSALMMVFLPRRQKRRLLLIAVALVLLSVLMVAFLLAAEVTKRTSGQIGLIDALGRRIVSFASPKTDASGPLRFAAWYRALELITQRPLLGHGWGSELFGFTYYHKGRMREATLNSHNSYLDIAIKTGIPGLMAFLLFSIGSVLRSMRRLKRNGSTRYSLALLTGVIAQLISAVFGSLFVSSTVAIYWISLGLMEVSGRIEGNKQEC